VGRELPSVVTAIAIAVQMAAAAAGRSSCQGERCRPSTSRLDGTVAEREFLGEFVRYNVKVGTAGLVVDQPHYAGERGFAPGARVKVGINPAQVKLLRA